MTMQLDPKGLGKACEHCGSLFQRPHSISHSQWNKRRFCSRSCKDASRKITKPWAEKACRAPHLNSARQELRRAIERGDVVRPSRCERCGKTPEPMKDGRSAIQGHHHDYTLPLDVQWLCYQCHRDVTPVSRHSLGGAGKGSSNHNSKLTEESVRQIRSRYIPWVVSVGRLATEYGVSRKVVREIVKGRAWTHV